MSFPKSQKEELRELAEQRRKDREARHARILELHRQGLPKPAIAKRLGIAPNTVKQVLLAAGERPILNKDASEYVFGDAV
jgi:DNA-binding NarL/FixJ family response regulator